MYQISPLRMPSNIRLRLKRPLRVVFCTLLKTFICKSCCPKDVFWTLKTYYDVKGCIKDVFCTLNVNCFVLIVLGEHYY